MYQKYFGFNEKPFTITPNPHFLFLSKTHKEVFAHLLYGIRQRCGFIELIGEVGTGKTTVLRTLMSQLGEEAFRLALIFNPSLSATELLRGINREFGLPAAATPAELLEDLNAFLLRENAAGRTVILVIDEAQNLEPAVLEQIRLLSNLETETTKLIQIILAGQPELAEILSRPGLRQLAQRITVRFRLQPMDYEDTVAYIEHRLRVAGGQGPPLFTPAAMKRIYRLSGGLPRLINVLCDRALLVGYAEDRRQITPQQVATARRELGREGSTRRAWWRQPVFLALVPLLIGIGAAGWFLGHREPVPAALPSVAPPAQGAAIAAVSPLERLRKTLGAESEGSSALAALNTFLPLWRLQPLPAASATPDLRQAALLRNLQATPVNGDLPFLRRFAAPLILSLQVPEGPRYAAATAIDNERLEIATADGTLVVTAKEIRGLWSGRCYLLWKNHLDIPSLDRPGLQGEGVVRLQELLRENGFYQGEGNGVYDEGTRAGVLRFQAAHGLDPDGWVGPQTLALLYANSRFAAPVTAAAGASR